ncbi:YibL family ribosome-associated protein [Photobacterium damselae]|nr:YibL family ribosome-associated protein [Photobacterium damselae]UKA03592.1 YibL family ribosome-associated protein [Photobacterium damselae subsp. damselae]
MNLNQELQSLNNRMDKCQRKLAAAISRNDDVIIKQFRDEIEKLRKKIQNVKHRRSAKVTTQSKDAKSLSFHRALTKQEQADMGKLKKSVKGLVVVHPMTALGRSMGLKEVTGYASQPF